MPAKTDPRSGLVYGWPYGANGWHIDMDANLVRLGRFGFHLSVQSRTLTEPPPGPAVGDSYIVAIDAGNAWLGHDGQVAVWDGDSWQFGAPRVGWVAYIEDEEVLSAFKAAGWSAGVAI